MRRIEDELRRFVIDNFLYGRQDHFSDNDSFVDMGIIDSTGMLELVNFLEHRYGIQIMDTELTPQNLDSISQLAIFLHRKLSSHRVTA